MCQYVDRVGCGSGGARTHCYHRAHNYSHIILHRTYRWEMRKVGWGALGRRKERCENRKEIGVRIGENRVRKGEELSSGMQGEEARVRQ